MNRSQTSTPTRSELMALLDRHDQQHLLRYWDEITPAGREQLARQIAAIDFDQVAALFHQTAESIDWASLAREAEPPPAIRLSDRSAAAEISARPKHGKSAPLRSRRARSASFLSREGRGADSASSIPKGMYPIGPVSHATLLQIHLEKAVAAAKKYGQPVPVYMMTSPITHDEQVKFLDEHERFGLPADDLIIFCQGTMPAVDAATGNLLLAEKDALFLSPDGHGGTVAALAESGAIDDMQRRGIEHLFYLQVDNPLTPICDPEFIGYHLLAESELTSMAVAKQGPQDKVGNFVSLYDSVQVIEYSDFPDDVAEERSTDESLAVLGRQHCDSRVCRVVPRAIAHAEGRPAIPYRSQEGAASSTMPVAASIPRNRTRSNSSGSFSICCPMPRMRSSSNTRRPTYSRR